VNAETASGGWRGEREAYPLRRAGIDASARGTGLMARVVSRRTVSVGLALYWAVVWSAVVFQLDDFPLTNVPMYAGFKGEKPIEVRISDREASDRGFRVTNRDGTVHYVNRADLNLTDRHFRRLYRKRLHGSSQGPWPYRVLRSMNRTLGHELGDPDFIVRAESEIAYQIVRRSDLHVEHEIRRGDQSWAPEYDEKWRREGR